MDRFGQGPSVRFQQMDAPRPQRNRIHFDVVVPHDEARRRIEAAEAPRAGPWSTTPKPPPSGSWPTPKATRRASAPGKAATINVPAGRSSIGSTINPVDCYEVTLYEVHDPDRPTRSRSMSPSGRTPQGTNRRLTQLWPRLPRSSRRCPPGSGRPSGSPWVTTRYSPVFAKQQLSCFRVRDGSRTSGRRPFPVLIQRGRGLRTFQLLRGSQALQRSQPPVFIHRDHDSSFSTQMNDVVVPVESALLIATRTPGRLCSHAAHGSGTG